MKHTILLSLGLLLTLMACIACNTTSKQSEATEQVATDSLSGNKQNAIYYWKTTFCLDAAERDFLRRHHIQRLYLRMFDVAVEAKQGTEEMEIVPIATTRFNDTIPDSLEIVPVVYITIEALRAMQGKELQYAQLIVERLRAMCSYNGCGVVQELQMDCDWTETTQESFFTLCREVKTLLQENFDNACMLSVTVRLHQLQGATPPADRAVLMLYNTGALKNPETKNSILNIDDVRPYLRKHPYPLPLDYAYPTYGWGVKFRKNKFAGIVSETATAEKKDEYIRKERPTIADILAVKKMVEENIGKTNSRNILYHLDHEQLQHYSDHEIAQIYLP